MNIEDLSKQQLLLLMILVNFVVSIATGVLTVSFLNQAPTIVTQTVNQIVDHTIQTVTQVPGLTAPSQPSVEDLLSTAIAAESARSVTIHAGASTTPAVAVGVYLPKSKAVATLAGASLPKEATIVFFDGSVAGQSRFLRTSRPGTISSSIGSTFHSSTKVVWSSVSTRCARDWARLNNRALSVYVIMQKYVKNHKVI
jgi:hypothetical protein